MKRRNKTSPNSTMSTTLKRDVGSAPVAKRLVATITLATALFATNVWAQDVNEAFLSASSPLARGEQLSLAARMLLQVMRFYARRVSIEKRVSLVQVARLP